MVKGSTLVCLQALPRLSVIHCVICISIAAAPGNVFLSKDEARLPKV